MLTLFGIISPAQAGGPRQTRFQKQSATPNPAHWGEKIEFKAQLEYLDNSNVWRPAVNKSVTVWMGDTKLQGTTSSDGRVTVKGQLPRRANTSFWWCPFYFAGDSGLQACSQTVELKISN